MRKFTIGNGKAIFMEGSIDFDNHVISVNMIRHTDILSDIFLEEISYETVSNFIFYRFKTKDVSLFEFEGRSYDDQIWIKI